MRNRKRRKTGSFRSIAVVAAMALLPVLLYNMNIGDWLGRAGENAAMLSAAIIMPDGSVSLLQERFRAEIYSPDDHNQGEDVEQGEPVPDTAPVPDDTEPEQSIDDDSDATKPSVTGPRIAEKYAAPIINENFAGKDGGALIQFGEGFIKNETEYDADDIDEILDTPYALEFEDIDDPQVLIFHTHATESFEQYDSAKYDTRNTWRSTDNNRNMVAVGDTLAQVLETNGIGVIHDTTQHDYPSYNGSYERSAETVSSYLEEYPSIKVVLDVHRDAMQRDDAIVKPVAMIDGKKAAQIMIISACDDGSMDVPEWRQNLRFAAAFQDKMETVAPQLTRPVYFCYRKYNMDLSPGSLLLEFGSNANTLEESVYSATLAGEALVDLIRENIEAEAEDALLDTAEPVADETVQDQDEQNEEG